MIAMDKLITALENDYINKKLKETNKYEMEYDDISYQEGILEILEKEEIDIILLSEILKGPYDIKELINKIKEKNEKIEIIIILEKKNEELEKFLKDKNINNYFYNNQLSIEAFSNLKIIPQKLNNNIDEIKNNILKRKNNVIKFTKKKHKIINLKKLKKENLRKKQIYSFFGKDSVAKSVFILIFSLMLKNKKILNIDFDFLNQNINTLFGVEKFPNKIKINNNLIQVNKNIDYLSGLEEMITGDYKNIISKINYIKNNYDYIFINLSSITNMKLTKKILEISDYNFCIFNNNDDILFNNNLLKIYTNEWEINKDKFICVLNNNEKYIDDNLIFNLNLNKFKLNKKIKNKYYRLIKSLKK